MTKQFHHDVEELKERVVAMGQLAVKSLHEATDALVRRDAALAADVMRLENEVDRLDVEIETRVVDLIALHQPMAKDLRFLAGSMKIITYLDRIGRYGYDIAKAAGRTMESPTKVPRGIESMAIRARNLVLQALEGYRTGDAATARSAIAADDAVDDLYDEVFRASLTFMMQDPATIPSMTEYLLAARHLERAADNGVKVAEKAIYIATGERRRRDTAAGAPPGGSVR